MTVQNKTSSDKRDYNHPIPADIVERVCHEQTIYTDAPNSLTPDEAHDILEQMQSNVHEHLPDTIHELNEQSTDTSYDHVHEFDDVIVLTHDYWILYEDAKNAGIDDDDAISAIFSMHKQAASAYMNHQKLSTVDAYVIQKNASSQTDLKAGDWIDRENIEHREWNKPDARYRAINHAARHPFGGVEGYIIEDRETGELHIVTLDTSYTNSDYKVSAVNIRLERFDGVDVTGDICDELLRDCQTDISVTASRICVNYKQNGWPESAGNDDWDVVVNVVEQ